MEIPAHRPTTAPKIPFAVLDQTSPQDLFRFSSQKPKTHYQKKANQAMSADVLEHHMVRLFPDQNERNSVYSAYTSEILKHRVGYLIERKETEDERRILHRREHEKRMRLYDVFDALREHKIFNCHFLRNQRPDRNLSEQIANRCFPELLPNPELSDKVNEENLAVWKTKRNQIRKWFDPIYAQQGFDNRVALLEKGFPMINTAYLLYGSGSPLHIESSPSDTMQIEKTPDPAYMEKKADSLIEFMQLKEKQDALQAELDQAEAAQNKAVEEANRLTALCEDKQKELDENQAKLLQAHQALLT